MKKCLYCLFLPVLFSFTAHSQDRQTVLSWQSNHPEVHFISLKTWTEFTPEQQSLVGDAYILFEAEVTPEDLLRYEESHGIEKSNTNSTALQAKENNAIKEWLAVHPDVKIIRQSEFTALSQQEQQLYIDHHSLILAGEILTVRDIENFHY